MLTVAIVEDDTAQRTEIAGLVQAFAKERGIPLSACCFEDGSQIADAQERFDLILMDIQMRHMDGMTAAMRIRERDSDVLLIFITSLAQYAVQGYKADALDFLVKPVTPLALGASLERALRRLEQRRPSCIRVKSGSALHVLDIRQILFVEAQDHRTSIRTQTESLPCASTLASLEGELSGRSFFRCHSAFLVNLRHVERIDISDVLVGGIRVPVSKHRRKNFMAALTAYWGTQL